MSDYIERGALNEKAEIIRKKMLTEKHEPFTIDIMNDFADLLDQYAKDIPAADVKPVVRATWEERDLFGWKIFKCTNCGETISGYPMYKYCHECGAKMGAHGKDRER